MARRIISLWIARLKRVFVKTLKWQRVVVASSVHNESEKVRKFCDLNWSCFKLITFRWQLAPWFLSLARVFQNLPAPPKHRDGVFGVFCDFQSFVQLKNLGSHLAMCPDDRFLLPGKQILLKLCQVRPMPISATSLVTMLLLPPGGGGYFRNFWVGMCRWLWDPGTLNPYQS